MEIVTSVKQNAVRPAVPKPFLPAPAETAPGDRVELQKDSKAEKLWRELFSGELFEIGLKLRPDQIHQTVSAAKDLGVGLKDTWDDLRKKVLDVLKLPQVERVIDPEAREKTTEIILGIARGLGYTAAGVQGLGGFYKLARGIKKGNTSQKLDGLTDIATAGAVATTIAGLGIVPLVMGPVAAAMGVARGSYNAIAGFRTGNARQEIQGLLDTTRSASVCLRLLGQHVAGLGLAGMVLGPIAGGIQLSRGYYDLSSGLAEKSKPKQVQGLTDIATAVGLTASLTGVGTIPGIALMAVAMGTRVLYQFSDRFEGWMNKRLEKWAPGLSKATSKVEHVVDPMLAKVRPYFERVTGWHRGQDKGNPALEIPVDGRLPSEIKAQQEMEARGATVLRSLPAVAGSVSLPGPLAEARDTTLLKSLPPAATTVSLRGVGDEEAKIA